MLGLRFPTLWQRIKTEVNAYLPGAPTDVTEGLLLPFTPPLPEPSATGWHEHLAQAYNLDG